MIVSEAKMNGLNTWPQQLILTPSTLVRDFFIYYYSEYLSAIMVSHAYFDICTRL
jgi:hypothetical protein